MTSSFAPPGGADAPLKKFLRVNRARLNGFKKEVRIVYESALVRNIDRNSLDAYMTEQAVPFYRPIGQIMQDLQQGFLLNTFKETLARLPTSDSFRESHCGEIAACLFAQEILGLRKLYSKLSLLTAQNSNAFKMDLLLYDRKGPSVEFVFAEVKSSAKSLADGDPPKHDKSCYAKLFESMRKYGQADLEFDIAAIKDNISHLPDEDRTCILAALQPYGEPINVRYAGFVVIDLATKRDDETAVLASRQSDKSFEVDLICVEDFGTLATSVYGRLGNILNALRAACSP